MSHDLEQKLQSLAGASEFEDGGLVLAEAGSPLAIPAMLHAIDSTILPRLVTFAVGASHVQVLAGGRRLRAVVGASDDVAQPDLDLDAPISREASELLDQVGKLFAALASTPGTLTLRRAVDPRAAAQSDGGVDAAALAEAWNVDLSNTPLGTSGLFALALGDDLLARVTFDDARVVAQTGDSDLCEAITREALQAQLRSLLGSVFKGRAQSRVPQMLVLPGKLPGDAVLCVLRDETEYACIAVQSESLAKIATAWNTIAN